MKNVGPCGSDAGSKAGNKIASQAMIDFIPPGIGLQGSAPFGVVHGTKNINARRAL